MIVYGGVRGKIKKSSPAKNKEPEKKVKVRKKTKEASDFLKEEKENG